ncbi:hypothetical protein ACU61A_40830 [Pseudonocardia sichuanensis]
MTAADGTDDVAMTSLHPEQARPTAAPTRFHPVGMTPWQTPGHHFALAANPSFCDQAGPVVIFAVADPDGHPFDLDRLAVLDRHRVAHLHAVLEQWLSTQTSSR